MCLGIPGRIVEITSAQQKLAETDIGGVRRVVNIACIVDEQHPPESCVGEWVLVHVGFAMSRVDPEEAQRTLDLFSELGEVQMEMEALRASAIERSNSCTAFDGGEP